MATDRFSWPGVACVALGAAALVFPWLPAPWPNPLAELEAAPGALQRVAPIVRAAGAVDAACVRGDERAFRAATTAACRRELAGQLAIVEGALDAATLREIGAARPLSSWLHLPVVASRVDGTRGAVAVERPGTEGVQVLRFVWDGQRLLFDGASPEPRADGPEAADAAVRRALRER
jgi:hypothetical protein